MIMNQNLIYHEILTSKRTTGLFLALAMLFLLLGVWSLASSGWEVLTIILLGFSFFFLFYVINYWKLEIVVTHEALQLKFGLFQWKIPLENIAWIKMDDLPWVMRNGGAGIHFMFVGGLYRAHFNFLEYGRLLVRLRKKSGLVQAVSISTQQPEKLICIIMTLIDSGS